MEMKKILTATDFSEASLLAVETAFNLSFEEGATLYIVHVLDIPSLFDPLGVASTPVEELEEEASKRLDTIIPENPRAGIKVEKIIVRGEPTKAIAEVARQKDADLIIVGTHGRRGLTRVLLGSTAEALLRKSPCQVLVAKHKEGSESDRPA